MQELINIKPEYRKLKNISPFWDDERKTLQFESSNYNLLQQFLTDYNIDIKIDNLCYIVCLFEQEKQRINIVIQLKGKRKTIQKDRLEVSDFLKKLECNPALLINSIKFDYGKNKFDKELRCNIFIKEGFFTIEDPDIINQINEIIWKAYSYKSSLNSNFKKSLKFHNMINDKHFSCEALAKSLNKYLTDNTTLSLNMSYFVIGFLFQFTGIETELSIERFDQIKKESYKTPYKSYPEFVTKNIRSKYFKGVTKQSKNI